ncbi:hypothetical protein [Pedobacter sp. SYSU D00535]|uniref:hypothetical protein n=1 Tax=Pedobacter sp. SYSU D00535 TaxID=2810308 RepID=UPI001A96424B|nr:hypothetical protein [Pedobacter sp. SYSU D00535]
MKKLVLFSMLVLAGMASRAYSQVNVNINIGAQPAWGPAGYDYAEYYYLPGIETYYHVPNRQFIYLNNGKWLYSSSLPSQYQGYDLYSGYKVVLNSPKPFLNYKEHKVKYGKYKTYRGQSTLRSGKGLSKNKYNQAGNSRTTQAVKSNNSKKEFKSNNGKGGEKGKGKNKH